MRTKIRITITTTEKTTAIMATTQPLKWLSKQKQWGNTSFKMK